MLPFVLGASPAVAALCLRQKAQRDHQGRRDTAVEQSCDRGVKAISCLDALRSKRVCLASKSPRRLEIVQQMGLDVVVVPSGFKEDLDKNSMGAQEYCQATARGKASAAWDKLIAGRDPMPDLLISSDTIVVCKGKVLEKPSSRKHAFEMLQSLSGGSHQVVTAVSLTVASSDKGFREVAAFASIAKVHFAALTDVDIESYIETGEPMDKAGGYGIQGIAGQFIEGIEGDFYTVMGLPLAKLSSALAAAAHDLG